MDRKISFEQYRNIDLLLLFGILAVCQFLIYAAVNFWYPEQLYVLSPVAVVVALVMMRWNGWAAIHALGGGVFFALLCGGGSQQLLIYGLGNLAGLGALGLFQVLGKEKIRSDALMAMCFGLSTQLLMQLGRGCVAALLGYPAAACIGFITTDVLSDIFTLVVMWVIRRIEGLFEDQKNYLLRLQKEQKAERGEQL